MLVIDASVALAWCFTDEATAATDALVIRVRRDGAIVPAHWMLEIMNALLVAQLRGRIALPEVTSHLHTIESLGASIDVDMDSRTRRDTLALAQSERLTAYDAAYLELAMRTGVPLATLDRDLKKAARKRGVAIEP